jgi:hypothetical protein
MKRVSLRAGFGATLLVFAMPIAAQHAEDLMQELEQCRALDDDDKRLVCYDRIGEVPSVVETTTAEDVREQDSQYGDLTDDIGLPKQADGEKTILATISSCGLASNRIFYFYFENGQIWKYVGNKRLKYRDCNREAKIIVDRFGFALQLEGETRSLRIMRVK